MTDIRQVLAENRPWTVQLEAVVQEAWKRCQQLSVAGWVYALKTAL